MGIFPTCLPCFPLLLHEKTGVIPRCFPLFFQGGKSYPQGVDNYTHFQSIIKKNHLRNKEINMPFKGARKVEKIVDKHVHNVENETTKQNGHYLSTLSTAYYHYHHYFLYFKPPNKQYDNII